MVHISQLDSERVNSVEDVVSLGDELTVMVTGIENGKVRLSRQAVLEGWSLEEAQAADSKKTGGSGSKGGNAGGNRKQKKRQSAQLRKLTLCNVKLWISRRKP